MTPSPRRTDSNQQEVMDTLRAAGYLVTDIHTLGKGRPDLAVSKYRNVWLLEVKAKDGKLTPDEREFIAAGWPMIIVYSGQDAVNKLHEAQALRMEIGY
jgi:hypothetical protein